MPKAREIRSLGPVYLLMVSTFVDNFVAQKHHLSSVLDLRHNEQGLELKFYGKVNFW